MKKIYRTYICTTYIKYQIFELTINKTNYLKIVNRWKETVFSMCQ